MSRHCSDLTIEWGYMDQENKSLFGFQWHITERCNLRCAHCYQDDYSGSNELDMDGLKRIADDIIRTLAKWHRKGDIAITGGEPLVKEEVFPLLNYIESSDAIASIDLLTNGTLINDSVVGQIKDLKKVRCIQISLDGASSITNDEIRGKGVFDKVVKAIRLLVDNNIRVNLMFTLQHRNMNDIPELINLANVEGISTLTVERFVPTGSGIGMKDELLTSEEIKSVFGYISNHADRDKENGYNMISRSRPLWILSNNHANITTKEDNEFTGGICSVGLDGLCILPDATVLACRRLPIPIGNLKEDSIEKIWFTSDLLWEIREKQNLKGKCNSCESVYQCSGCRAMAYAITGDFLESDPQCWK